MLSRLFLSAAAAAVLLAGFAGGASAQVITIVDEDITTQSTADELVWCDDEDEIVLDRPIFVTDGQTLTIECGCIVRGQPRTRPVQVGAVVGSPGALIVTREGRVEADCTADNPVIFTTAAPDNDADTIVDDAFTVNADGSITAGADGRFDPWQPGDRFLDDTPTTAPLAPLNLDGEPNVSLWGGMVILGRAPTNMGLENPLPTCGDAAGTTCASDADCAGVGDGVCGSTCQDDLSPCLSDDDCLLVAGTPECTFRSQGAQNTCNVGDNQCTVEGLTIPGFPASDATYGAPAAEAQPNDDSGIYRYIEVRHAGDEIGDSNELNGITLGAVGAGTVFENISIYCNFDDGIEWFGGTVNGKYLAVQFAGDDAFDVDQGYNGFNQYAFAVMPTFDAVTGSFGSGSGDKAGEWDGDDFTEPAGAICTGALLPNTFQNVTVLGSSPDTGTCEDGTTVCDDDGDCDGIGAGSCALTATDAPASNDTNRGIQMRNGYTGYLDDAIIVNTGSRPALDIDGDVGDACPGRDTIDHVNACVAAASNLTSVGGATMAGEDLAAAVCGGGLVDGDPAFPGLVNADQTFNPRGNAAGKLDASLKSAPIDPRPVSYGTGVAGSLRGAFRLAALTGDADADGVPDATDVCPNYPDDQTDTNGDGRGDACQCGDTGFGPVARDGEVNVTDILAVNSIIFNLPPGGTQKDPRGVYAATAPLCDATNDGICNVADIIAINGEIFAPAPTSSCDRTVVQPDRLWTSWIALSVGGLLEDGLP